VFEKENKVIAEMRVHLGGGRSSTIAMSHVEIMGTPYPHGMVI
jgi:hypothetical protein